MSSYRRANELGGTYFFTLVTYKRQAILCDPLIREALHQAIKQTRVKYPFIIDAWVLLPDHLHCIWTLPKADADFSKRWALIKRRVSLFCAKEYKQTQWLSESQRKHRESTLWQQRFWEHKIRDQYDLNLHLNYIHYNPVKHQLCDAAISWPYSTFHRYVKEEKYPRDWAATSSDFENMDVGE